VAVNEVPVVPPHLDQVAGVPSPGDKVAERALLSKQALAALLDQHRGELVGFVRKRAGHLVDPEDVVQQAALRALTASHQVREVEHGRAWLFRIVRNQLSDELRKIGVPTVSAVDLEQEAPVEASEACRCAMTLAKTLKPDFATILERTVFEDSSITAVAKDLGLSPNTATVRLHRARKALRHVLQQHCGTSSLRQCLSCVCEERGCCATR
jgi:RNA polymerase sigma-70 factor, ECF subfamily